jgi:hypothetical protein
LFPIPAALAALDIKRPKSKNVNIAICLKYFIENSP